MATPVNSAQPLFRVPDDPDYDNKPAASATQHASLSQPIQETYNKIAAALKSQSLSEQHTFSIENLVEDGDVDISRLYKIIDQQKAAQQATRAFLDSCLRSIPITLRPTAASAIKAQQVFGTPELLEQIFLYLTPREVLHAMQTNTATYRIFLGSPKLEDKLSLRPSPKGFLDSVFVFPPNTWGLSADCFKGFHVDLETEYDRRYQDNNGWSASPEPMYKRSGRVEVHAGWCSHKLPIIGSACRKMLVCQPPLHEMRITVHCCNIGAGRSVVSPQWRPALSREPSVDDFDLDGEPIEQGSSLTHLKAKSENDVTKTLVLRSTTGITVGDIYDATKKLREAHRNCPHASIAYHDEDGAVISAVTFDATLQLKSDDPHLIEGAESEAQAELDRIHEGHSETAVHRDVLGVYVKAKRKGFENGWAIPTFEEFKAKHGMGEAM